jgi:hypothetical protein
MVTVFNVKVKLGNYLRAIARALMYEYRCMSFNHRANSIAR